MTSDPVKEQVAVGMCQALVPVQDTMRDGDLLDPLQHQLDHLWEMTAEG